MSIHCIQAVIVRYSCDYFHSLDCQYYSECYGEYYCRLEDVFIIFPRKDVPAHAEEHHHRNCSCGKAGEVHPNATTQTYVLGRYNETVGKLIMEEFLEWRTIMQECLEQIYGPEVGAREAEAMMILISGTFICNYNRALTGEINDNIIGYLANLAKS